MLDFKDWKKTKEDGKSVTMSHPKGHSMTVLFKGIPIVQKEALKRLPLHEGGEAKLKAKAKANYAEGTPEKPISQDDATKSPDQQDQPPVTVNVNSGPPSTAGQQAQTPVNVQQPNVNDKNPNVQLPNGSMSAPGTAQTSQQALQEQKNLDIEQAKAVLPIEQAKLQAERDQAVGDQNRINALSMHADNLAQNINKIDPDAYRKNMSAPSKVATGLGLFLGGFSVPFGGQNFAGDFLNKQIDRDINSQIQNNENQKTIWGAYNTLYGNQTAASAMAKASMADIYKNQLGIIAAKFGTPQAIINYHKGAAQLADIKNKAIMEAAGNLSSIPNNPNRNAPATSQGSQAPMNQEQAPPSASAEEPQANNEGFVSKYLNGRLGSTEQSQGSIPKNQESEKPVTYPILAKDAESKLNGSVQYGAPKAREDYPAVSQQFTAAQQLEKFINGPKGDGKGGIHEIFQKLYQSSGEGGLSGMGDAAQRLAHVDIMGNRIKVPALTESGKFYELQQNRLKTDLASALHGLISVNDIDDMVSKYSPGFHDTPALAKEKEADFVNSLKNALQTSQLGRYNMLAK